MNACKNCRHYWGGVPFAPMATSIGNFPYCTHPSRKTPDPVHGIRENNRNCYDARKDEQDCGPAGRMYEPSFRHRLVTALFGSKVEDLA